MAGSRTTSSGNSGMRVGLSMCGARGRREVLTQHREGSFHFVPRVRVARFLRDDDAVGKKFARLIDLPETRQMLAELEVSRNVLGMNFEEFVEVASGSGVVPQLHALERKSVAGKSVAWLVGNELLEDLAARFLLCSGHRINARYYSERARAIQARCWAETSAKPRAWTPQRPHAHKTRMVHPARQRRQPGAEATSLPRFFGGLKAHASTDWGKKPYR